MASYYDKILSSNKKAQPRHSKKLITLDDSIADEDDKPNIFAEDKKVPQRNQTEVKKQPPKQKQTTGKTVESEKKVQLKGKKQNVDKTEQKVKRPLKEQKQRQPVEPKLEYMNHEEIEDEHSNEQPQVHGVSKKSWLSLFESMNLSLGHFLYTYNFPIRREIPIIANNLDLERQKYENGTYISESFDNNLQISFLLFFLKGVLIENFLRLSVILWILAVILSFVIGANEQYRPGREILLGIFIFYCVLATVLQFLSLRGRRDWLEPSSSIKYKVYHFDNETRQGEWKLTDVSDLRPGNIYKVPPPTLTTPSTIPADSVLLHGPRTILQVDQSQIVEYLSPLQKQQRISLKQILIKTDVIMLPLTGVVHYELAAPQILEENIYGRFTQQEPTEETFSITYNNVVVRGSRILSSEILLTDDSDRRLEEKEAEVLAVVLETGIDSLVLKTSQYPYQYRKQYTYTRLIDKLLIVCSLAYLLITGAGILIGYIYLANDSINRGYHIQTYLNLGETPILLPEIVLHHFGNLIMIVPLLMRIAYLLFVAFAARIVGRKINVDIKDFNMLAQAREADVLVTTIGSDLIRMGNHKYAKQDAAEPNIFESIQEGRQTIRNRSLQSIRVSGIHHNFLTTRIDNELYSTKDVDMICYFMSIALLTCNRKNPTPLQGGIIERCNKELNVKIEKVGTTIKIGQLRVIKIFTIPATEKFPYKVVFYRHGKDVVEDLDNPKQFKEKVLCLIRGDTTKLSGKISEVDGHLLSEFSSRLHQEKGFHIELLGKFVLSFEDFMEVKRAYMGSQLSKEVSSVVKNQESRISSAGKRYKLGIDKFYDNLDRYMLKVDPMGLLIWQNPYSVLSSALLPISSLPQPIYKIIIAPASKSQLNPEFESIHAITNYLLKTSKLSLREISKKILHTYSNKETFWTLLATEKILVLNGWDYRMIRKMLSELKEVVRAGKKPIKLLSYIQQDQYAWVLKESSVSIATKGDGHDLEKYSDILINSDASSTTTDIIRRLFLYSQAYSYCLKSIIILHFMKGIMLATIEFINLFYTWGTGLALIGSPLYLILEIGILLDFLYYLFPRIDLELWSGVQEPERGRSRSKGRNSEQKSKPQGYEVSTQQIILQFFSAILLGSFITLLPIYSMTEPPTSTGTVQQKYFTNLLIHFILYHILVLRKIFMRPYTMSIYKAFIIAVQLGVYYLGVLIVSAVDTHYRGVIWFVIQGRIVLIAIFVVWMAVGVYWLAFMLHNLIYPRAKTVKNQYEKLVANKKEEQASIDNRDIKVGEPVDID